MNSTEAANRAEMGTLEIVLGKFPFWLSDFGRSKPLRLHFLQRVLLDSGACRESSGSFTSFSGNKNTEDGLVKQLPYLTSPRSGL